MAGVDDLTAELRERDGVVLGVTRLYRGGLVSGKAALDDVLGTDTSAILLSTLLELVVGMLLLLLAALDSAVAACEEEDKEADVEAPSDELLSLLRATFDGRLSHNFALCLKSSMACRAAWFFDMLVWEKLELEAQDTLVQSVRPQPSVSWK